ncbi:hypothetical protein H5410_039740 [Solanum commersonii]|uniref:S-protein homolog n=1 Tax=Solanum commersonii TaxID=4109 RepID=A0A9J5XN31_SOLCO|nr:hypothetical protein H5410_039740 [Solanum commersonii]
MTNASFVNPAIREFFKSNLSMHSPLLTVHCQSKDDDLGVRTLKPGDKFNFSFHENFLGTTRFYCRFDWGQNYNDFDVYYKKKSPCKYKFSFVEDLYCTWLVKDSGIYLARTPGFPFPDDFKLAYTWLKKDSAISLGESFT